MNANASSKIAKKTPAASTINAKNIIKENLTKITSDFKNGIDVPKNVTVGLIEKKE